MHYKGNWFLLVVTFKNGIRKLMSRHKMFLKGFYGGPFPQRECKRSLHWMTAWTSWQTFHSFKTLCENIVKCKCRCVSYHNTPVRPTETVNHPYLTGSQDSLSKPLWMDCAMDDSIRSTYRTTRGAYRSCRCLWNFPLHRLSGEGEVKAQWCALSTFVKLCLKNNNNKKKHSCITWMNFLNGISVHFSLFWWTVTSSTVGIPQQGPSLDLSSLRMDWGGKLSSGLMCHNLRFSILQGTEERNHLTGYSTQFKNPATMKAPLKSKNIFRLWSNICCQVEEVFLMPWELKK